MSQGDTNAKPAMPKRAMANAGAPARTSNNPNSAPGIYDVKSGSEATALDNTKYAEW